MVGLTAAIRLRREEIDNRDGGRAESAGADVRPRRPRFDAGPVCGPGGDGCRDGDAAAEPGAEEGLAGLIRGGEGRVVPGGDQGERDPDEAVLKVNTRSFETHVAERLVEGITRVANAESTASRALGRPRSPNSTASR